MTLSGFSQEVVFYEDGEPVIDGEPGDLKVWHIYILARMKWYLRILKA